ncbi:MAG: hypothetical protein P8J51_05130 [Dehalococcoidia bacterium]|nr:hypothetical protein [Dehalococcoidia bacterium]
MSFNKNKIILMIFILISAVTLLATVYIQKLNIQENAHHTESVIVTIEHDVFHDIIYQINPKKLSQKKEILKIEHLPNWSINTNQHITDSLMFVTIPNDNRQIDNPRKNAEIAVIDLISNNKVTIGHDADLMIKPIFDKVNQNVIYRSTVNGKTRIISYNLKKSIKKIIYSVNESVPIIPLFVKNDNLFVVYQDHQGSNLMYVDQAKLKQFVKLSNNFTRNWSISPNKEKLLYLEQDITVNRSNNKIKLLDIDSKMHVQVNLNQTISNELLAIGAPSLNDANSISFFSPIWSSKNSTISFGTATTKMDSLYPITKYELTSKKIAAVSNLENGIEMPIAYNDTNQYLLTKNFNVTLSPEEKIFILNIATQTRFGLDSEKYIIYAGWWELNE